MSLETRITELVSAIGADIKVLTTDKVDITDVIDAAHGGTGQTTYTVGDLFYADTATTLAKLSPGTAYNTLRSNGPGAAPSFAPLYLTGTSGTTGTLPASRGGTGAATLTGLVKGNGTGAFTAAVAGTDYVTPAGLAAVATGTNTGDETDTTIKTKLGITTLSGTNTGDQTLASLGGQPIDADLSAIAALAGTSGLLKKTAADTWELDTTPYTDNLGTVTSVTGTEPVISTGGTTPVISMAAATASVDGYMTSAYASKLDEIEASANNYTHPATHPATSITQDASNRFVTDAEKAAWNAKQTALVSGTNIRTVNGQPLLGSTDLVIASGGSTSLSGTTTIYPNQEIAYTITDFDSFSSYSVGASAGNASISGSTVTFTAPATSGSVTLTVTTNSVPRAIALTVLPASVAAPTITSPSSAATGVTDGPTITSSDFGWIGVSDTHLNTDWELWTGPNRTGTKVASLYASTTSKTSWAVPTGLTVSTTYYPAVLHRGTVLGASAWGVSSFTTAASFNAYIATPAATPAAFGDAFEGGFYTGMIWNELVQTATSTTIGTGSKTFTVADMTASPLVYGGQTLEVRSRANPTNKMIGVVTGALGTALTLNITSVGGSGTFTDWSIMAQYRVIVAPKSTGENASVMYKNADTAAPAACGTLSEGRKATLAMVAAGTSTVYPAAHWCNNLSIAGKTDWYLPARDELELCWRNLKPAADANYTTADRPTGQTPNYMNLGSYGDTSNQHGVSNNTSPSGAAHTSGVPAQVAAGKNFRTGEAEAFLYGSSYYWSSSEYSATFAWLQLWVSSYPGYQSNDSKTNARCVRAVRRSIT